MRGIELEKLLDEDSLLVYEMNGSPLPYYHGYPVRLIVPGWAADHSVKWLTNITVTDALTTAFWTSAAYRYPNKIGKAGEPVAPSAESPLTGMNVKSIITKPGDGSSARVGAPLVVSGFAWSGDGAYANKVEISFDGGRSWQLASLGESPGKYSWRTFSAQTTPQKRGSMTILARAHDNRGGVQPDVSPWNPGGYLWNAIARVTVNVQHA